MFPYVGRLIDRGVYESDRRVVFVSCEVVIDFFFGEVQEAAALPGVCSGLTPQTPGIYSDVAHFLHPACVYC